MCFVELKMSSMSTACRTRIMGEIKNFKKFNEEIQAKIKNGDDDIVFSEVGPASENDISEWKGYLHGPKDSPYFGGKFELRIKFGASFPFQAPSISFNCKMYHPNIDTSGKICVDILNSTWVPAMTLDKILLSLSSLLTDPNPSSPLNGDAASYYQKDRKAYDERVRATFTKSNVTVTLKQASSSESSEDSDSDTD